MIVPSSPFVEPPLVGIVPVALVATGARRLDARAYLTDGYGVRRRLESTADVVTFGQLADVWQPSRLKGQLVDEEFGLPFLSAGQVFESRPRPRKWLAESTITALSERRVEDGWLLLSRSGQVGRVTAVYPHHLNRVITDDLLRIVPTDGEIHGWLYAFMRTALFRAQAVSAQYGHMIKHLEPEHVRALPVPMPPSDVRRVISRTADWALTCRRQALTLQAEANRLYEDAVNPSKRPIATEDWGPVPSYEASHGRRRFEGAYHRPAVRDIETLVRQAGCEGIDMVRDLVDEISLGDRFKRHFGPKGKPYYSASDLFDVNAPITKRIYAGLVEDAARYLLHSGWLVMACSGQTYGLLGRTMILGKRHEGGFGSHDLIRLRPNPDRVRPGYLQIVLSNETYGRPLVVRHAFGTSIPHLDPVDIGTIPVPRLGPACEDAIANACELAFAKFEEADDLETRATEQAEVAVSRLMGQTPSVALVESDHVPPA